MSEESYEYDAFISYRHVEPDRSHAMWLHKALETYKVPKDLVKKGFPSRLKKVFRDEDELPASADLSGEIDRGLKASRFLIVICSPRIISSIWCDAEVKRFRELGRHNKIIALLTEGEPSESFLPSLCEIRQHVIKDGAEVEEIEAVEPLAADIRERPDQSQKELKHLAKLRLIACILGCKFDDLRRRELRRKQRMYVTATAFMLVLLLCFASLTVWALKEKKQAEQNHKLAMANEQKAITERKIAEERKKELLEEKLEVLKADIQKYEEASKFYKAVQTIVKSIDICQELGKDYSSYAKRVESAYNKNRLIGHIPMKAIPENLTFTKDGKFILADFGLSDELKIISVNEKKLLHSIKLDKPLNLHSSSIIRTQESGHFCHMYNTEEGAHWVKMDPAKGKVIEQKLLPKVELKCFSGLRKSSYDNYHSEFILTERISESKYLYKVLNIEDMSTVSSFTHNESIVEMQFVKLNDGFMLGFRDSRGKFYLLKNGLKTSISAIGNEGQFYLHQNCIIVSGENTYLVFIDNPQSKVFFKDKTSVFISDSGKAYFIEALNTHIKPAPNIIPISKILYGVKKIIDQSEMNRLISLSRSSALVFSGKKRFYIDQINKVRASAAYKDLLVTVGHFGGVHFWDLSLKKSYKKIVDVPEGISFVDKSDTKNYLAIRPKKGLKFRVFNSITEESREVIFPATTKKFAKIKFLESKNILAYTAADKFKMMVPQGEKFPPQKLSIYDIKKDKWLIHLDENDAYFVNDYRIISNNDESALKYQNLSDLGQWKFIDKKVLGTKSYHKIYEDENSVFCLPNSGQYRDKLIKLDLKSQKMKLMKELPEGLGVYSYNSLSEDASTILRVVNDENKTRCYLHDLEKDEIKLFPGEFNFDSRVNVEMNNTYLIVSYGYPTNLSLYDLKTSQRILQVQLPSSISTFIVYQLSDDEFLIKDKILKGTAFIVSSKSNKVVKEIKMDTYEPIGRFYLVEDSDLISIKNINDEDFLYEIEVDDFPSHIQFSQNGKSIIFSQKDGLYKLDFLKSENRNAVNKARTLLKQVGDF